MTAQAIIVIGASTGGLEAFKRLFAELPASLPAAVLVVMHIGSQESILPQILSRYTTLPVRHGTDGEAIETGTVLIAPSDRHLLVEPGRIRLSRGPKENFSRPAIDPLFRSAAVAYRSRVVGVLLSGKLDDGTVGLQAIKAYGGITMVQDPEEAEMPSMPLSAMTHVDIDYCLRLDAMPGMLFNLADKTVLKEASAAASEVIQMENQFDLTGIQKMEELDRIGMRSALTCPECHGNLWEIKGGLPQRFRCHTGHAYTALALATAQNQATEEAIWGAVRALHEKQSLMQRFAERARNDNRMESANEYDAAADQAAQHSELLRKLVSG